MLQKTEFASGLKCMGNASLMYFFVIAAIHNSNYGLLNITIDQALSKTHYLILMFLSNK